jgi:hypothetical protein
MTESEVIVFSKEDTVFVSLIECIYYTVSLKTNVISTSSKQVPCINISVISVIQNWIKEFLHYFVPEMLSYRSESLWMTLVLIRYVVLCNGIKSLLFACYFNKKKYEITASYYHFVSSLLIYIPHLQQPVRFNVKCAFHRNRKVRSCSFRFAKQLLV